MGRQVRQMVRLVDDLFDLSRIMQGKLELRKERVQLAAVVADAVETARPVIDAKGHELAVSLPAEPVELDADPTRLAQAFTNLLTNAAKYSESGGRIDLTVRREGPEIVLSVRDTGVGIGARDVAPDLRSVHARGPRGRSFAGRAGGRAGAGEKPGGVARRGSGRPSAGVGRGSEFLVRLPAPAMEAAPDPKGGLKPAESKWPRHRVLVVDDNEDSANALGKLLKRLYGQEVKVAHDGPSSLAVAQAFLPDVVLLDLGLPGMDGYEVARRLRGMPGLEDRDPGGPDGLGAGAGPAEVPRGGSGSASRQARGPRDDSRTAHKNGNERTIAPAWDVQSSQEEMPSRKAMVVRIVFNSPPLLDRLPTGGGFRVPSPPRPASRVKELVPARAAHLLAQGHRAT